MPITLVEGEEIRREQQVEFVGGGLFFTPTTTVWVTNLWVVATESFKRGNEITKYIPLEGIIYMQGGRFSSPRWLYATVFLLLVGIVALIMLGYVGAVGLVVATICFVIYWFKLASSLIIESGGSGSIGLSVRGQNTGLDDLLEEVEMARLERVAGEYGRVPTSNRPAA